MPKAEAAISSTLKKTVALLYQLQRISLTSSALAASHIEVAGSSALLLGEEI